MLQRLVVGILLTWVSAGLVACGSEPLPMPPDSEVLQTSDDLYGTDHVWQVAIELDDAALSSLNAAPREYVAGDITINEDQRFEGVGVRLKGSYSFQGLNRKAAFKVKFNWDHPGRRFLGLEGLTFNNMIQDRANIHEWLSYRILTAIGVPSPRSGYVWLTVNGADYGLYANVETVDDSFLERHFADPSGNLYEEVSFCDLYPEDVWDFEQDEGANTDRTDLLALTEVANQPDTEIFDSGLLDTDAFLAMVFGELLIGHWDGYYKAHNYRLYHEPTLDRWTFLPWGTDQTFERRLALFAGNGMLTQKCFAHDSCRARYLEVASASLAVLDSMDLAGDIDHITELIGPYLDADPRKPWILEKYLREHEQVRAHVREQAERLRPRLSCMENGVEVDGDGDGFGACLLDCDDSSSEAHPGGVEVCDGLDNDCNGNIDDDGSCACPEYDVDGVLFRLCAQPMTWIDARNHCRAQGLDLAWIDDPAQNAALFAVANAVVEDNWFIGLNDRVEDATYQWSSGEPVGSMDWGPGNPDDHPNKDCVILDRFSSGQWLDESCTHRFPFVCR